MYVCMLCVYVCVCVSVCMCASYMSATDPPTHHTNPPFYKVRVTTDDKVVVFFFVFQLCFITQPCARCVQYIGLLHLKAKVLDASPCACSCTHKSSLLQAKCW